MYILKCLIESKMKTPLYCVVSPQGVCTSEVEGLLPNRSPPLFEIAVELLGIPATLVDEQDSVITREAYQICKGLRDGENIIGLVNNYGWSNPKKEKDVKTDDEFWIFRGRRKEEGPFGEEYGLAWLSKFGLAKFRYIDLSKDGYEEEFYQDFARKIEFYQKNEEKEANTVTVYKYVKENKGIKLFTEVLNQGTLTEYIERRKQAGKALTEATAIPMLHDLVLSLRRLQEAEGVGAHGSLHSKTLYVHDHRIVIGEPIFVTDKVEKKLRELKTTFDYYAPEMKENIILPENLMKLSFQKMDVWSFGFIAHKLITRDLPAFDPARKPILAKALLSPGMHDLITRCLSVVPANRPEWGEVNVKDLQRAVVVEEVEAAQSEERSVIRLGTSKEMPSQKSEKSKKRDRLYEEIKEEEVINLSEKGPEEEKLKTEEE
jgi:serine/threonine protein kinase